MMTPSALLLLADVDGDSIGRTLSSVIGWAYTLAWGISFYPQVIDSFSVLAVCVPLWSRIGADSYGCVVGMIGVGTLQAILNYRRKRCVGIPSGCTRSGLGRGSLGLDVGPFQCAGTIDRFPLPQLVRILLLFCTLHRVSPHNSSAELNSSFDLICRSTT